MDLLRGCGDICNSNSPNNKNCSYKKKIPHSPNCSSQIKISSCTSPEPHCSNSIQSGGRYVFENILKFYKINALCKLVESKHIKLFLIIFIVDLY